MAISTPSQPACLHGTRYCHDWCEGVASCQLSVARTTRVGTAIEEKPEMYQASAISILNSQGSTVSWHATMPSRYKNFTLVTKPTIWFSNFTYEEATQNILFHFFNFVIIFYFNFGAR